MEEVHQRSKKEKSARAMAAAAASKEGGNNTDYDTFGSIDSLIFEPR